jgi:hypothetical protein
MKKSNQPAFRTITVQVNTSDINPGGDIDKYV